MRTVAFVLGFVVATSMHASPSTRAFILPSTYQAARTVAPIVYVNREYGFRLTLPPSWKGYTVLDDRGEATDTAANPDARPAPPKERYAVITIRHPLWTKAHPHEDLPIMIFTRTQWKRVEGDDNGGLVVSAAPFPPSELSRNGRYVFALPARYNYDYATGWRELERILKTKPLQGF